MLRLTLTDGPIRNGGMSREPIWYLRFGYTGRAEALPRLLQSLHVRIGSALSASMCRNRQAQVDPEARHSSGRDISSFFCFRDGDTVLARSIDVSQRP
jgi:hypothetical protein